MQIVKIHNPFQRHIRDVEETNYQGKTIEIILIECLEGANNVYGSSVSLEQLATRMQVSLNGSVIPPTHWGLTKPTESDQMVIMPIVAKGDDGKQILNIVIMVVAFALLGPGSTFVTGTLGLSGTAALIVGGALVAGTGLLVNSLTPAPSMGGSSMGDWEQSNIYGWNPQTTQKQGIPKPKYYGENKLYGNVVAVHTVIDAVDDTKQIIKMLIGLGSGPVEGIVAGSLKINDQFVENYTGVTTEEKRGLLVQTPVSFFTTTQPEYRPNRIFTNALGAITYTTPDSDFDDLDIELIFPRGVYYADNAGNIADHTIGIKVEISESGADTWSTLVEESITDNVTKPKRVNYLSTGTYTGGAAVTINNGTKYDIRLTKTSTDETTSRYGDKVNLTSVREIINDQFTYPLHSLLGVSAIATDQISGSLSVSCIQEGAIVDTYNGTIWTLQYSSNPAWVLYDVLSDPVISGDGDGTPYAIEKYNGIPATRLDTAKFYELAQFCDELVPDGNGGTEKRISFNGGFDVETNRWEAALKVCEIARCVLVWNGTELTLAIDKPAVAVQMFTVGNILEDTFKETFMPEEDMVSELEIHYRDKLQDYKRVPFTVINPNIDNPNSRQTLNLFGVNKQSEAWRIGKYRLGQNELLKSTVEFEVDIDAIACTLGDVVYVQHDVPEWGEGGRVVSGTTLSIIVDQDLTLVAGNTYDVLVRKKDDTINTRTCTSAYNAITAVTPGSKLFKVSGDYTDEYKDGDRIKITGSTGNDDIYTLDGDSTFASSETTIIVDEVVPDATVDGGLFNLRRVVVSVTFKNSASEDEAPDPEDIYTFGIQNLNARLYRILRLSRSSDQIITMNLIEYNAELYDIDDGVPGILPDVSTDPANSGSSIVSPPSWDDIHDRFPDDIFLANKGVTTDIPLFSNLGITEDSPTPGYIAWAGKDGINPISFTIEGASYSITAGNTNKKYIYWDENFTTSFQSTDTVTTAIGEGKWIMMINVGGTADLPFGSKVIHAGMIKTGTIESEHIAADAIVASKIDVVDLAAISATLGNVVVDGAKITNATIVSAKIGNLEVKTSNLDNNSTQIIETATTDAAIYIAGYASSWTTIQSESIVSLGNLVKVDASVTVYWSCGGAGDREVTVQLRYGTTVLREETKTVGLDTGEVSFTFSHTHVPGAGTKSYSMRAQNDSSPSGCIYGKLRYISLSEWLGK